MSPEWTAELKAEIFRGIKACFVRHGIDLGLMSIAVTKTAVAVRGKLDLCPGSSFELTAKTVDQMIDEAKQVKGVQRLDVEFENWRRGPGGGWIKVK